MKTHLTSRPAALGMIAILGLVLVAGLFLTALDLLARKPQLLIALLALLGVVAVWSLV